MNKTKLFMTVLVGIFLTAPAFADSDMKPSYANKKSGQVAFVAKENASDDAAAAQDVDLSKIEPAAGASEQPADAQEKNNVAENIKLPRKN